MAIDNPDAIEMQGKISKAGIFTISAFVICLASGALAEPSHQLVPALQLIDAPVDYRASYSLTAAGHTYSGIVVHAPGRERREFEAGGARQILLLRRDTDEAAILWPERHFYLGASFHMLAQMAGNAEAMILERHAIGQETVNGERTTVYAVADEGKGGGFSGKLWLTADGILMRAVGTVSFQGKETPIDTSLTDLRRVKADPASFIRPSDYFGVPLSPSGIKPPG